jgi:nucleotidyltransferase/DNA polymerase involved in DNA repair
MFATIYVPDFCLQAALRHAPELRGKPVALIDDQERKAVIIQLNAAAEQTGVHRGMTPSQGLARSLQLQVRTRMLSQEKVVQEILLHLAETLAPYIEATSAGIATVQFTDNKNLLRNVTRVIEQLADAEIIAQAGIAPTPDASFLAAHLAKPVLQIPDASQFLAELPIEVLAIDSKPLRNQA